MYREKKTENIMSLKEQYKMKISLQCSDQLQCSVTAVRQ